MKLDTSIPNATTVIIVPSTVLLEKLSTIGEARVWTTPRQNVIADPIAASKKTPFFSVRPLNPSRNSVAIELETGTLLSASPFRTTRVVEMVTKNVQISMISKRRMSAIPRRNPARTGDSRYFAEPANCTSPLALLNCSAVRRSVIVDLYAGSRSDANTELTVTPTQICQICASPCIKHSRIYNNPKADRLSPRTIRILRS